TSFRVSLTRPAHAGAFGRQVERLDGVDQVVKTPTLGDIKHLIRGLVCISAADLALERFLDTDAPAEQEAQVGAALESDPAVTAVSYVSKHDAVAYMRCAYP